MSGSRTHQVGKQQRQHRRSSCARSSFQSARYLVPLSSWQSAYCSRCWEVCKRFLQTSPQISVLHVAFTVFRFLRILLMKCHEPERMHTTLRTGDTRLELLVPCRIPPHPAPPPPRLQAKCIAVPSSSEDSRLKVGFWGHSLTRFNLIPCIPFWRVAYKTQQIKTYYLCSLLGVNAYRLADNHDKEAELAVTLASLVTQTVKASACNAGDPGSIPGSGRSPGEGNGNPLQHSCLENPMDRGGW